MNIAPALLHAYPTLNEAQRAIVSHSDGPLLIIAGPGSGKTFSLVLRAMNLLVLGKAAPRELVLCTFTEKAGWRMKHEYGYRGLCTKTLGFPHLPNQESGSSMMTRCSNPHNISGETQGIELTADLRKCWPGLQVIG